MKVFTEPKTTARSALLAHRIEAKMKSFGEVHKGTIIEIESLSVQ